MVGVNEFDHFSKIIARGIYATEFPTGYGVFTNAKQVRKLPDFKTQIHSAFT